MAITINDIITLADSHVGDATARVITETQRLNFITESVNILQEELGNDHSIKTYTLPYLDTVNEYEVAPTLADILVGATLRAELGTNIEPFAHRGADELHQDIANGGGNTWAIERRDGKAYILVNYNTYETAYFLDNFSTVDNWTVSDDATNITLDKHDAKDGSSLNFDLDVSLSANDKATITNTTDLFDLSKYEDTGTFIMDVYIPDSVNTTSYTLSIGSDTSNYWTMTATTDIDGNTLADKRNTVVFEWSGSTQVGSPDVENINYVAISVNYGVGQTDDTDYRIYSLRVVKDTELTFSYLSTYVGKDASGTDIMTFTATTDIPYFSDQYDNYKFFVAHWTAGLMFNKKRNKDAASTEFAQANRSLKKKKELFPASRTKEGKSFRPAGINFARRMK